MDCSNTRLMSAAQKYYFQQQMILFFLLYRVSERTRAEKPKSVWEKNTLTFSMWVNGTCMQVPSEKNQDKKVKNGKVKFTMKITI